MLSISAKVGKLAPIPFWFAVKEGCCLVTISLYCFKDIVQYFK